MTRLLRIAQAAPPLERVPPRGYGGTERVVHELRQGMGQEGGNRVSALLHKIKERTSGTAEQAATQAPDRSALGLLADSLTIVVSSDS